MTTYRVDNTGEAEHTIRPQGGEEQTLQRGQSFTGRFSETELRSMRNATGLRVTHLTPTAAAQVDGGDAGSADAAPASRPARSRPKRSAPARQAAPPAAAAPASSESTEAASAPATSGES